MADTAFYSNALRRLLSDPSAMAETPGYKFMRDQALEATQRQNASQRGSFNALAALQDRAAGLAATEYGNTVDRYGRLLGQEQQYGLGEEGNRLTGIRDSNNFTLGNRAADTADLRARNDMTLGTRSADTADRRVGYDYELGKGGLDNARRIGDQNFGLGMYRAGNDYDLGLRGAANDSQRAWWDYRLGSDRNANDAAANANRYNLDAARLPLDWYQARTSRGSARSADWARGDESAREWRRLSPPRTYF